MLITNICVHLSMFMCVQQDQHMMEYLGRPHTWAGSHRQYHYQPLLGPLQPVPPIHIHQSAPPAPPPPPAPQPPPIIQHTV